MTNPDYIKIQIGDFEIQATDPKELPISIDYALEDESDFQKKPSGNALDIEVPATLNNTKAANTFNNPSVQDLTNGEIFKTYQPAKIIASGTELLIGKGILKEAKHTDVPTGYVFNVFGDNADWVIDLKDLTLYDILKDINFVFSKANVVASWAFDGTNENLPYVFAPIRYRDPFNGYELIDGKQKAKENTIPVDYLKPSLSKYFIIYWALQRVGYRIQSNFFETSYYRRMVMPWVWGNFLNSEGTRLDVHKFLAKSTKDGYFDSPNGGHDAIFDLFVSNDSTDGAFDNNNDYSYDAVNKAMVWQYKPPYYGNLQVTFSLNIQYAMHCTGNSSAGLYVQWYKNGVLFNGTNGVVTFNGNTIDRHESSGIGGTKYDNRTMFATANITNGDIISAKIHRHTFESKVGTASITASILQFQIDYFTIPVGGTIDFQNYTGLKKFKFLDFFAGEVDNYDLNFKTDNQSKTITLEPTHAYSLTADLSTTSEGFFKNDTIDWDPKKDYSKEWNMELFSDGEREQLVKFKDDSNDGLLKVVQDRNIAQLAQAKYVLPDRFKEGPKERENRFFAPVMHYEVDQFAQLGTGSNVGIAPQMIAIIPENISNTSNSEAANTFIPKSVYYKGNITGAGAWSFDNEVLQNYPFAFAVNYKTGGQNDPILSYCDEKIKNGSGFVLGIGLFKRFYWQRFAIMRNGQWYTTYMRLLNSDVANQMHREYKIVNNHRWELINIRGFLPLQNVATQCLLRKFEPITQKDLENSFPSNYSVMDGDVSHSSFDVKYNQLIALQSDIPK